MYISMLIMLLNYKDVKKNLLWLTLYRCMNEICKTGSIAT